MQVEDLKVDQKATIQPSVVKNSYKVIISDEQQYGLYNYIAVYTHDDKYIGTVSDLENLFDLGIFDIQTYNHNQTCSIGFNDLKKKWYGWSHRAICGFEIGHVVEAGNIEATPDFDNNPIAFIFNIPVGFKCETLEDCKKCAINFAAAVA